MNTSIFEIDSQLVSDFARDGVVVVRGLVQPEMIELLALGRHGDGFDCLV